MSRPPLRILISGRVGSAPRQGGATWAVLQYVLGLQELGHTVHFVEAVPPSELRPRGVPLVRSVNAGYCAAVLSNAGLSQRWALVVEGTDTTVGLSYPQLRAGRWDVHINLSGCLRDRELTDTIPVRAYLDLDPAFTQLWHQVEGHDLGFEGHTHFATVGWGIGEPDCPVPTGGIGWYHSLPPVVLSHWTPAGPIARDAMTTVANWRSYGSLVHSGIQYGQRAHSFRDFFSLPARTSVPLRPALAIDPAETDDISALREHGWIVMDPRPVSASPAAYRNFVRTSRGEFSIAKSGYVQSRSGWFSDRSACYLASGRPVVAQDTGFGRRLPTGWGLLSFTTPEEAALALERVGADYALHARAARRIAADELDSAVVLGALLEHLGAWGG